MNLNIAFIRKRTNIPMPLINVSIYQSFHPVCFCVFNFLVA